mgnify:CR=1 FL=1
MNALKIPCQGVMSNVGTSTLFDIVGIAAILGTVSVAGGFRGLGERYSSALLNGSPLPSPEPLRRVAPLAGCDSRALQQPRC